MTTPYARGGRSLAAGFLALSLLVSALSATFLPAGVALAEDAVALGDTLILDGPGGQYGILTVAPAGAAISVDGEAVDGYYPVSYNGVGGWTAIGLVEVTGGGNGGGGNGGGNGDGGGNGGGGGKNREMGNGGVETVSADPVYSDNGSSVNAIPAESAEPVTGGTYGPGGAGYSEQQVLDIIHEAAMNYGQSPDDMVRVARCESGLDPYAVGGGGAYYGLFQFVPSTFSNTPYGQYEITDAWANANAAAWMWSEGKKSSWVCQ